MFDEALTRLYALGNSTAAILPGLLVGLVIFGVGLLVAPCGARGCAACRDFARSLGGCNGPGSNIRACAAARN